MIVDWQYEPIKGRLLHIDLKRIAMDKAMVVEVPILLEGIPVGVKNAGRHAGPGVARGGDRVPAGRHSRATSTFDVSGLKIHDVVRVSDLPHAGKFKFITDEDATVAHVTAIKEEVAPEADAVVAAAPAEPEVAKKGKRGRRRAGCGCQGRRQEVARRWAGQAERSRSRRSGRRSRQSRHRVPVHTAQRGVSGDRPAGGTRGQR